jgi:hypothetical protein
MNRKRLFILTPLQTALMYIFIGVAFGILPAVLFTSARVLIYFGAFMILYSPIAAFIVYMGRR